MNVEERFEGYLKPGEKIIVAFQATEVANNVLRFTIAGGEREHYLALTTKREIIFLPLKRFGFGKPSDESERVSVEQVIEMENKKGPTHTTLLIHYGNKQRRFQTAAILGAGGYAEHIKKFVALFDDMRKPEVRDLGESIWK